MTATPSFKVKDWLVIRGVGLGRLKQITDSEYQIAIAGEKEPVSVAVTNAPSLLRPLISRDQAQETLDILMKKEGAPDDREWGKHYVELQRVRKSGEPKAQAILLQRLYRCTFPLKSTHERVLDEYEEILLPELAHVLGTKPGSLKSRLHKGQPAFGYTAPERPQDGPVSKPLSLPDGWGFEDGFRLYSGKLAIGEYPGGQPDQQRGTFISPGRNGVWVGLHRETPDAEDREWEYAIVHESVVAKVNALLPSLVAIGEVGVDGGTIHVADSEVCDDRTWQRSLEAGEPLGRAFICNTGGDGGFEISGHQENGELVLILVPC